MNKDARYALAVLMILSPAFILSGREAQAASAASVSSPYLYNFNLSSKLFETSSSAVSSSPYWWLNSGGYFILSEGKGSTAQSSLSSTDPWRILYNNENPQDTDEGYHPQNIFRLITRNKWQDARQEAYFVIKNNNLSD